MSTRDQKLLLDGMAPAERRPWIRDLAPDDVADLVQLHASEERRARMLNPELRVPARRAHLIDAPALERAGAKVVAAGEAEVGVAPVEALAAGRVEAEAQAEQRKAVRARLHGIGPALPTSTET